MYVKQSIAILFLLRKAKMSSDGKCPIYVRLTIHGLVEEMSTGCKVLLANWNLEDRRVTSNDPNYVAVNKRLRQIETDLERVVDLTQAKDEIAVPEIVFVAYKTPIKATRTRQEKEKNETLSRSLDETIGQFLDFNHRFQKAHEDGKVPPHPWKHG